MSDMKKLIEAVDAMAAAEKKPTGPKFPGYWKGKDSAAKSHDKMVGSAEESVIKDLHSVAKKKVTEWSLTEEFKKFKEAVPAPYTGIDPIVRQRMGMAPATRQEIGQYLQQNPPGIKAGDGYLQGPAGVPLSPKSTEPVYSGGQMDVLRSALDAAGVKPEELRSRVDLRAPATQNGAAPTAPAAPAQIRQPSVQTNPVPDPTKIEIRPLNGPTPPVISPSNSTAPAAASGSSSAAPSASGSSSAAARAVASTPTPYRGNQGAREIQAVNPSITDVNKIKVGQRLKLPNSDEDYIVQRGDTLDKIGKMFRGGEIGGRVISTTQRGDPIPPQTLPAPAARPQPAPPTNRSTSAASRPQPRAVPPTSFDPPGADTDTSDRPATATRSAHPEGTRVSTQIKDPRDPTKPMNITVQKGSDGIWRNADGSIRIDKPAEIAKVERMTADPPTFTDKLGRVFRGELPSKVFGRPRPQQNETVDPVRQQFEEMMRRDDKIGGRYDPEEFDSMVRRVGKLAKQVPLKTVYDEKARRYKVVPVNTKPVKEYENMQNPNDQITSPPDPTASASSRFAARNKIIQNQDSGIANEQVTNTQDPNQQTTSPGQQNTSPTSAPNSDVKKAALDQQVDIATAKGTMGGLKNVLGPNIDVNQAASAATKISDGKPLSGPEQQAISSITPLMAKAAETPQTAMALKTALSNAALLAKQGK